VRAREMILSEPYLSWLYDLVTFTNRHRRYNYYLLIKDLHIKKFRWFIPNDDNRAFEGKNLRELFCKESGVEYNYDDFEEPVSMLEVILALAFRCESIMIDGPDNASVGGWFWKLLTNIDLDNFTDDEYYSLGGSNEVFRILDIVVERKYNKDGLGGLFPLKKPKKNQRKVELWYQMCHFLTENFYVEDSVI